MMLDETLQEKAFISVTSEEDTSVIVEIVERIILEDDMFTISTPLASLVTLIVSEGIGGSTYGEYFLEESMHASHEVPGVDELYGQRMTYL